MDLILEVIFQLVVQVFGEWLIEGAIARLDVELQKHPSVVQRIAEYSIGGALGLGFGIFWGDHLSGRVHYPRLMWVSIVMGVIALVVAALRRPTETLESESGANALRNALQVPWRWGRSRFIGLAVINAALVVGILLTFRTGGRTGLG